MTRYRDRAEIRPRSGCQIWSKLADLLVGRRSSACNGYVTDPSSHDECVHRTQKHRKPLSETLHHARRARHRAVARNQPHLALRPAPPRRPPHTKRWFRALAVIASGPGHPPRSTVTTRKTRRLACYVFLHVALLLINSRNGNRTLSRGPHGIVVSRDRRRQPGKEEKHASEGSIYET